MAISVHPCQPGDEEGIVDLLRQSFPNWAARVNPAAYWRWKYLEGEGGSLFVVAEDRGRIVGCHGYVSCARAILETLTRARALLHIVG